MAKRVSYFQSPQASADRGLAEAGSQFLALLRAPAGPVGPRHAAGPTGPQAALPPFSGTIDLTSLGTDGFRIEGATISSEAGAAVSGLGDVNGDGIDDFAIGVRLDDEGGQDAGASYVIFGSAAGFTNFDLGSLGATAGFKIVGDAPGDEAAVISGAGDINNDGFADIIVGAPGAEKGGTPSAGATYLIFGKASGFGPIDLGALAAADGFKILGAGPDDRLGYSVASAGDVNNDGFDDLVLGAPDVGNLGRSYVIFGKASAFGPIDLASLSATDGFIINGEANGEQTGRSVASAGDVNNDGFSDIIVGAPFHDGNGVDSGAAYVIFGRASGFGTIDLATLASANGYKIVGEPTVGLQESQDAAGFSVSGAGDINGDGYDDVIVGADANDEGGHDAGAAYVIFGKASGFTTLSLANFTLADGFKIIGAAADDLTGFSVSRAGDVNGDGFDDIIVGAPYSEAGGDPVTDDFNYGAAYLIFGRAGDFTDIDLSRAFVPADGIRIFGEGFLTGYSVSAAGDVNDDGVDDLIIGAPLHDGVAQNDVGSAYVIYGRTGLGGNPTLGTPGDDLLFGTGGFDDLNGLGGNDYIEGFGGTDRLAGGPGDDVLVVADARDLVVEAAGEGFDTVYAGVSYTLNRGSEIEILAARDNQSTDALTLTGNALANRVLGNNGDNIIDGGGGGDVLAGYGGDDIYILRSAGDIVVEETGRGNDILYTDVDFTMSSGLEIETVSALTTTSTTPLTLIGNDLDNILIGNNGRNVLFGGAGNDTLQSLNTTGDGDFLDGGTGVDSVQVGAGRHVVVIDNTADVVTGTDFDDVIYTTSSYTLGAGNAVGTLSVIDHQATDAIDLTGNALANGIVGNNGNNVIDGKGGSDHLLGFGGADTYAFTTALGAANMDTIYGFSATDDTIALDDAVFAGLAPGAVAAGAFLVGTAAADADDRIIYNSATGALYFDADGNGAAAMVQFATLSGAPLLTAGDFTVI